jgi:hypothetical protein
MCFHSGFKKIFCSQKVGTGRSSGGKFSALGHATRPSYGGPKFDFPDFPLDFALWKFASNPGAILAQMYKEQFFKKSMDGFFGTARSNKKWESALSVIGEVKGGMDHIFIASAVRRLPVESNGEVCIPTAASYIIS